MNIGKSLTMQLVRLIVAIENEKQSIDNDALANNLDRMKDDCYKLFWKHYITPESVAELQVRFEIIMLDCL